jgi:hypothetical protein
MIHSLLIVHTKRKSHTSHSEEQTIGPIWFVREALKKVIAGIPYNEESHTRRDFTGTRK